MGINSCGIVHPPWNQGFVVVQNRIHGCNFKICKIITTAWRILEHWRTAAILSCSEQQHVFDHKNIKIHTQHTIFSWASPNILPSQHTRGSYQELVWYNEILWFYLDTIIVSGVPGALPRSGPVSLDQGFINIDVTSHTPTRSLYFLVSHVNWVDSW